MATLVRVDSGKTVGKITDEQLQFLVDQLVVEDSTDREFYINKDTLALLSDSDGDPELLQILRDALGDSEDMDIRWE